MPLLGVLAMGNQRREERPRPSYADPASPDFDPARAMDWLHGFEVEAPEEPPAEPPRLNIEEALREVVTRRAAQHRADSLKDAFIPMERELDPDRLRALGVDRERVLVIDSMMDPQHLATIAGRIERELALKGEVVLDLETRSLRESEGGFRPGELVDLRNPLRPRLPPPSLTFTSMELTREEILNRIGQLNADVLPKVFHALEGIDRYRAAVAQRALEPREEPETLQPLPEPATEPKGDWRTIEEPLDRLCAALGYPVHRALYVEHLKAVSEALVKQARKGAKRTGQTFDATYNALIEQRVHARRHNVPRRLTCQVCGGAHHTWS